MDWALPSFSLLIKLRLRSLEILVSMLSIIQHHQIIPNFLSRGFSGFLLLQWIFPEFKTAEQKSGVFRLYCSCCVIRCWCGTCDASWGNHSFNARQMRAHKAMWEKKAENNDFKFWVKLLRWGKVWISVRNIKQTIVHKRKVRWARI